MGTILIMPIDLNRDAENPCLPARWRSAYEETQELKTNAVYVVRDQSFGVKRKFILSEQGLDFGFERNHHYPSPIQISTNIDSFDSWLVDDWKAVTRLSKLEQDWNNYGSEPPLAIAIEQAKSALKILFGLNFRPTGIDPSVEGGVCLSFSDERLYADIEFFNNGKILAVTTENGMQPEVWELTPNDIFSTAIKLKNFLRK